MIHNHPCNKTYLMNNVWLRRLSSDRLRVAILSDSEQTVEFFYGLSTYNIVLIPEVCLQRSKQVVHGYCTV